ncbi:MAG TPA: hypothetical protein VFG66_11350 [Gemmatimonadales bacterium]|nr:hypothetical protein [Gemmatimonadales bacterium]
MIGEDVLLGVGEELSIDGDRFRCDAVEFERLVATGESGRALSIYEGDFLAGFCVADISADLEEWVDRTRVRLRRHAATAARLRARAQARSGPGAAIHTVVAHASSRRYFPG